MGKKSRRGIIIAVIIFSYLAADVVMDIYLFPQLPEELQEHHKEIVERYVISFALIPIWITGYIIFDKHQIKPAAILFGSTILATGIFAFTSLPFIWFAHIFPLTAPVLLFLHDYSLFVYFLILIIILGYNHFKQ